MKKFCVLCVLVLSVGACSSKEKAADETTEPAATAPVEAAADTAKKETAKADATAGSKSTCTQEKDNRILEVKKTESGGCELFYSKFGEPKSVASSGFGVQYCEEVKDRIESNLLKAGFSCQ